MYSSHFLTRYGTGIVYATDQGVVKVEIPDVSRRETAHHPEPPEFEPSEITVRAAQMLQRYFNGERIDFGDIPVVLDGMTPFRQKILNVIRNLTFGEICSYGQVAESAVLRMRPGPLGGRWLQIRFRLSFPVIGSWHPMGA